MFLDKLIYVCYNVCMKTVRLYCEAGQHHWERPSQRGRRPVNCPQHSDAELVEAPPKKSEEELVKIRREAGKKGGATRAAKVAERKAQDAEQRQKSVAQAVASLPELMSKWEKALDRAAKAKETAAIKAAFNEADNLQGRILGIKNAQRQLERAA